MGRFFASASRFRARAWRKLRDMPRISVTEPEALVEVRRSVAALTQPEGSPPPRRGVQMVSNRIEHMLLDAVAAYGDELAHLRWWARLRNERDLFPSAGMYDWIEAQIAYLLIRLVRPQLVVEISPNCGYTTGFILLALNRNGQGELHSFDLEDAFFARAHRTFSQVGLDYSRQHIHVGDARETALKITQPIDLLFMDSDHTRDFARWYIENLYPRVRDGALVHAHDVLRYGVQPHQGDRGEGKALWEFIEGHGIPETNYLYVADFVRQQPLKPSALAALPRFPFGEHSDVGSNGLEMGAALWMIKEGW